jgi:hypothetical protein
MKYIKLVRGVILQACGRTPYACNGEWEIGCMYDEFTAALWKLNLILRDLGNLRNVAKDTKDTTRTWLRRKD